MYTKLFIIMRLLSLYAQSFDQGILRVVGVPFRGHVILQGS